MKKKLSLVLLTFAALLVALAAGPVFAVNLAEPASSAGFRALSGVPAAKFGLPNDVELINSFSLPKHGLTYERYQQFFGNAHAEVLGGQLTLYKDESDKTVAVIGNHYNNITPTNAARRSNENARDDVARDVGPGQKVNIDLMINPATGRFFHRVETQRKYERWFHWIDADNGKVLNKYDGIAHACDDDPPTVSAGNGCGVKGDTKNMSDLTTYHGGRRSLRGHWLQSPGNRQLTYDDGNNGGIANIMIDANDDWDLVTADRQSPGQPAGVDAHYYASVADKYFLGIHDRHSYNNDAINPANQISIVHSGIDDNNAYWSGSSFVYGDGDGIDFIQFSGALDVVGHEWTHAVTEYTSNLIYLDASGALNESYSDMMGTAIEFYANELASSGCEPAPGPTECADWLLGEDIDISGNGFRNMADPEANGSTGGYYPARYPDHYSEWFYDPLYLDGGGVHINSGISNHWFYLMAQPVGQINMNASCASLYDGSGRMRNTVHCAGTEAEEINVTAIGLTDAEQIAYATFIALPSNATFRGTRLASQAVAEILFPGGTQRQSVSDAWDAVGVLEYQVCDKPTASIPFESDHFYADEIDCIWTYDSGIPGGFSFQFSRVELETNYDYIYILDANNNVVQTITGFYPDGLTTNPITTSVGKVRLVTDWSVTAWGFEVVGPTGGGGDSTAPTVDVETPANLTDGVAVTTVVTATFSEAMNGATINTSTFTLEPTPGAFLVVGDVSYGAATETATFTPDSLLAYDTTYTARVTTGAQDLAENGLAAEYTWSFTTAAAGGGGADTVTITKAEYRTTSKRLQVAANSTDATAVLTAYDDGTDAFLGQLVDGKLNIKISSSPAYVRVESDKLGVDTAMVTLK